MVSISQIAECLSSTLSPNTNIRIAAELKLAEYLVSPDAGLALSQLVLSQQTEISLRIPYLNFISNQHSATIILRKYVTERWSPVFPTFRGSAPPVEIKSQIRLAVFHGLSDPDRKIRTLCAHVLSSMAHCDWPDEYPELLKSLIGLLSSNSPESVHGAMQVFTEFIKSDLTEDQILPVLRELLPVLLAILGSPEAHTAPTRARTVSVFRQCITALFMVKDQHPQAVKEAIASVLPVWLEAFKVLLNMDPQQDVANTGNWDGLTVRTQIFKTLDTVHTSFPRALTPYLRDFLTSSLNHLQALYPTFNHYYLSSIDSIPRSSEDESIELPQLICPITDFVAAVTRGGKAKDWFETENLTNLILAVFNFVQMTNEDEDTWTTNANAFVAQEEDETLTYSIRVAGFDLLGCLVDRTPAQTVTQFQSTIQHVVQSSQQSRDSGNNDWWRPLEAALAAIGSQAEAIMDCIEDEQDSGRAKPIDIEHLLSDVIPSLLGLSEFPFLQGRGFVFASQYTKLLPLQLSGRYLDAAVQVIEATEAGIPVKISAVKAIHNFCQGGDDSALTPFVVRITKDLGPFLMMTSDDTLSLVLETLSVVLEVEQGKWLTVELADTLVLAVLDIWHKNNKDPIFLSILTDILESLASSSVPGLYETVVKQALPALNNALGSATTQESWIASSAIELVSSLVKGSPDGGLGDGFFALIAPNLFKCLGEAEDRDILQNGIACLTLVIRKDCNQLISWRDAEGRSGLDYVLKLVAKLLENQDESGGLVIGDLIIHLLRRAGEAVLPVLPQLLQAMVARMMTAKTATFLQSLIIPFAFLVNHQRDTVLSLLETTTVQNRSGLDVLIQTWCENAETFQGFWPARISTMGLSQLFAAERPSLQNLMVKGDIIVKPETKNVIMTRSRTKTTPHEFTSIPFPVKALKILLRDVHSGGEAATFAAQGDTYDVDSDDGDEDWTEEEKANQGFKEDEFAFLSEMIGPKGMAFDNDDVLDESDDEDLKNDPISQMDMQAHLVSFFRECAARNTGNFAAVVEQLSAEEMVVIRQAVKGQ
ncbi:armadillo-type protein [Infundibulicybe gibba]|nr:armadillo-type protein [Infundibulicybe gibba]